MGYRFNRLDEPVFIAVSKLLLTEFGIHYILEGCEWNVNQFIFVPTKSEFKSQRDNLSMISGMSGGGGGAASGSAAGAGGVSLAGGNSLTSGTSSRTNTLERPSRLNMPQVCCNLT